jgi:hypothetical protein
MAKFILTSLDSPRYVDPVIVDSPTLEEAHDKAVAHMVNDLIASFTEDGYRDTPLDRAKLEEDLNEDFQRTWFLTKLPTKEI